MMFLKIEKKVEFLHFLMNHVLDYFHHVSQQFTVDQIHIGCLTHVFTPSKILKHPTIFL